MQIKQVILNSVNSQSKFHSGNSSGSYFNKKDVVEFSVGRRLPKMKEKKYQHMTLEDRIEIQECLSKGVTFKDIGK